MSEQSIKKLKKRVVFYATLSFALVMLLMGGFIFCFNMILSRTEIRRVLRYIADNDGAVPDAMVLTMEGDGGKYRNPIFYFKSNESFSIEDIQGALENLLQIGGGYNTPEYFYMLRYFAVLYDEEDAVEDVIVSHIRSVSRQRAIELANETRSRLFHFGNSGDYYYLDTSRPEGGRIVVYLDSTSQIYSNNRILIIASFFLAMGSLITFFVMRVVSSYLIKPEIRNVELQKQFLTNASHELKTPLSVIRANTELLELTSGENEWTVSTMRQVDRLQGLIENLVMITRAQERDARMDRTDIDVSRVVRETAQTFEPVARQENRGFAVDAPEELHMTAAEGEIRQITSLLVDNAIKYCDEGGTVTVCLQRAGRRGKGIRLSVSNHFAAGRDVDYDRFFERFYRADDSHNIEKGGYGIGLSIAEQIVGNYNGVIRVSWNDGVITFACTLQ